MRLSVDEIQMVDRRPPVLLLRCFADDKLKVYDFGVDRPVRTWRTHGFEEVVSHGLRPFHPVLAIGSPQDLTVPVGAARKYIEADGNRADSAIQEDWQAVVWKLIERAEVLAYVVAAEGWIQWELEVGAALRGRQPIVLVVPPLIDEVLVARWAEFSDFAEPALGIALGPLLVEGNGAAPLMVVFAGQDVLFIEGDDRSGRSYLIAIRTALVLVSARCGDIQEMAKLVRDRLPDHEVQER